MPHHAPPTWVFGPTTQATKLLDFSKLVLFQTMLPSLLGSLDCGFRYALMVGFDAGDLLFDDPTGTKVPVGLALTMNSFRYFEDLPSLPACI